MKKNKALTALLAISLLLLAFNIYFYTENKKLKNKIERFKPAAQKMEAENSKLKTLYLEQLDLIAACNDSNAAIKAPPVFQQLAEDTITATPQEELIDDPNFIDLNKK